MKETSGTLLIICGIITGSLAESPLIRTPYPWGGWIPKGPTFFWPVQDAPLPATITEASFQSSFTGYEIFPDITIQSLPDAEPITDFRKLAKSNFYGSVYHNLEDPTSDFEAQPESIKAITSQYSGLRGDSSGGANADLESYGEALWRVHEDAPEGGGKENAEGGVDGVSIEIDESLDLGRQLFGVRDHADVDNSNLYSSQEYRSRFKGPHDAGSLFSFTGPAYLPSASALSPRVNKIASSTNSMTARNRTKMAKQKE